MSLDIKSAFNLTDENIISDDFIQDNNDLMWIKKDIDLLVYIPSYMNWCLQHKERNGNLVCDYTINALAEHGRAKENSENLNFKYLCNKTQRGMVYNFLVWCKNTLKDCNEVQIERALKHWQ
ncbi:hypothetical protein [Sulfurovum sp.]|uniref:hypothetical protein n=1 Tax=Sulfurovum sp. TaxID=1969726 RepID=UPI0025D2C827|nr:hypothetical protein [Sulfurovum sp.]